MADGVEIGRGHIAITADAAGAVRQVERQFGGAMPKVGQKAGKGMSAGFLGAAGKIAGPLAALFAVDKIAGFFTEANAEAREAQKVGATTTQIVKSTGGAAKITASQVGDLATAISNKAGVDDEAIQSGANLLLTFKNVRNEAGKGNKIFDQATQAAVDLSAAGFGSIDGASKMLGKALNDPVKGISALGRAGVTFTDQQKTQIKTLVKSGKTLEAQKIIMGEVQSQVGGVAAASATAGEKMGVAFGNFKEQVGTALLPLLDKVEGFVTAKVIPALSSLVSWLSVNAGPAFARLGAVVGPVIAFIGRLFSTITAGGGPAAGFLQGKLVPAFMGIVSAGQRLGLVVLPIIRQIAAAFMREWPRIQPVVMEIFKTIGGIVLDVMGFIQKRIQTVTAVIKFIWDRWGPQITKLVTTTFTTIFKVISGVMKVVGGVIKVLLAVMQGDWKKAGQGIQQIVSGIKQILGAIFNQIKTVLQTTLTGTLTSLTNKWKGFLSYIGGALRSGLAKVKDFVLAPIRAARDALSGILNSISGKFSGAVAAIGRAWNGLKEKAKAPVRFVVNTVLENGILAAFRKIASLVGMATGGFHVALPRGFRTGGYTGGMAPDRVAGVVHGKEYVLDAETTRKIGPANLDRWRSALRSGGGGDLGLPGYSLGGYVKALSFAKKQVGKPYVFGSAGPGGYDCSGFMAAIQNVIEGKNPYNRRYSTPAFHGDSAQGFTRNKKSAFMVGVNPAPGKSGHMAGTLLGTNVESAGGVGVRAGRSARGYNDSMFSWRGGMGPGFAGGGAIDKALEFIKAGFDSFKAWFTSLISGPLGQLKNLGGGVVGQLAAAIPHMLADGLASKVSKFDSGGYLQPGYTLAYNGTGRPERIRTAEQEASHGRGGGPLVQQVFPASVDPMAAASVAGSRVVASLRAKGF